MTAWEESEGSVEFLCWPTVLRLDDFEFVVYILDSPGFIGLNLSLSRNFRIRDRSDVQFRWEAFNVTNHTSFRLPNVDVANAGTITSAQPARVMRLAVRYQFW